MENLFDLPRLADEIAAELKSGDAPRGVSAGGVMLATTATLRHLALNTHAALGQLEARIRELESAPSLKYVGTWRHGETYMKNSVATDHGALWLALENTAARPPSDGWKLIVQRGKG